MIERFAFITALVLFFMALIRKAYNDSHFEFMLTLVVILVIIVGASAMFIAGPS